MLFTCSTGNNWKQYFVHSSINEQIMFHNILVYNSTNYKTDGDSMNVKVRSYKKDSFYTAKYPVR